MHGDEHAAYGAAGRWKADDDDKPMPDRAARETGQAPYGVSHAAAVGIGGFCHPVTDCLPDLAKKTEEVRKMGAEMVDMEKKAMPSQPMAGKTEEEIAAARGKATADLEAMGHEAVNTHLADERYGDEAMEERGAVQVPLRRLAKSPENMGLCHAAYFAKGREDARGCRIEHDAAAAYGPEVPYGD